jgi:hypothetical protein
MLVSVVEIASNKILPFALSGSAVSVSGAIILAAMMFWNLNVLHHHVKDESISIWRT